MQLDAPCCPTYTNNKAQRQTHNTGTKNTHEICYVAQTRKTNQLPQENNPEKQVKKEKDAVRNGLMMAKVSKY